MVTSEDRILHGLTTLINSLTDEPTYQSDAQLQDITALMDASFSWASPNETPAQILLPDPAQTRQSLRDQKSMLKQPKLQHPMPPQPTPRVPNKHARCEPAPRVRIQQNLPPLPPPNVHPKKTAPYYPIAHHNRYHTQDAKPPVYLDIQ